MTQAQRTTWIHTGQWAAGVTLGVLAYGAAAQVLAQATLLDPIQAATNATVAANLTALTDRVGKLESQNNYVLAALVGSLITQLVQLRTSRK